MFGFADIKQVLRCRKEKHSFKNLPIINTRDYPDVSNTFISKNKFRGLFLVWVLVFFQLKYILKYKVIVTRSNFCDLG